MDGIGVLLVDDQRLFVDNLKIVLEARTEDIRVLGIAYDGAQAVEMAESLRPEIVLLDVRMPGMDGVEAARRMREARLEAKLIMLTTFDDDLYVNQALVYGAYGYILKNVSPSALIESIRAVHSGSRLIPQAAPGPLLGARPDPCAAMSLEEMRGLIEALSARELQIVKLIALAYDNRQIATRLGIAEQTVKNALSAIYGKLEVSKRTQLMRFFDRCREKGLVD
jgi:Response regulator containing a CheY-like receiver domain and an HTH DNA-binding domain